ncbi:MAG: glycosyltransferase family 4 protein [Bacteroidales bacterium]
MRIIHIIPGSGGSFYCGNCLRDSKYVVALRKMGHEVIKVPMYLPLFADEHDLNDIPVFYGAISIYLKQLYPFFEKAPKWFDKLLNSKPMLKMAAGMAGSTRAKGLSEMTISMLKGEHGHQHEELDRMIDWMKHHCHADVVHLSNALLSGLAPRIKEKLGVKVYCSLQDEDVWIDVMKPEFREEAWNLMHENGRSIDRFISVSQYFSAFMKQRIRLPDYKVKTIYLGIDPADYEYIPISEKPRNIGFISRMCEKNGLDILVEAFISLKDRQGFQDVNLILTGGSTGDDKHYINMLKKRIDQSGLHDQVEFLEDFEEEGRKKFFRKVSVLSVPVRIGEAFGLYLLESMASGVPVVQPALGAFPEIIRKSGGGIVYEPNQPEILAESLAKLLSDPEQLALLSQSGYQGVHRYFDIFTHARELIDAYETK